MQASNANLMLQKFNNDICVPVLSNKCMGNVLCLFNCIQLSHQRCSDCGGRKSLTKTLFEQGEAQEQVEENC